MIAGPSEVLVIADHTANPAWVAADLLSQAEHDRLASAVLLTDSMAQAQAVSCEMERMARALPRWEIIRESVAGYGCAIVFEDLKEACKMADMVAPEHLEVMTAAPRELLPYLHNAGAIFLGRYAPEPLGDYMAGPCHVLPTSGTARVFLAAFDGHVPEENQHHRIHARRAAGLRAGYYCARAERTPGRARELGRGALCGGSTR